MCDLLYGHGLDPNPVSLRYVCIRLNRNLKDMLPWPQLALWGPLRPAFPLTGEVFLLGYSYFTTLCYFLLYGEVNQLHVHKHPLPPGWPQGVEWSPRVTQRGSPVLCSVHGHVHISPPLPVLPTPPFPPLGVHTFVFYVCVYFCLANRLICTIFLDSKHMW